MMSGTDLTNLFGVSRGRGNHCARRPHHRLENERRDSVGAARQDFRLQLRREVPRKVIRIDAETNEASINAPSNG